MIAILKDRLAGMVAGYVLAIVVIAPLYTLFELKSPAHWWVDITEMESVFPLNELGEPILFTAVIDVKRDAVELDWRHRLWCRTLGSTEELRHWSTYEGKTFGTEQQVINVTWAYLVTGRFDPTGQPNFPAECELRARVGLVTPFIKQNKPATYTSERFIIQ